MTNEEKIIKLNELWYDLIGQEHHKDRDCHFYLTQRFSYGNQVSYIVEHNGYINSDYGYLNQTTWDTLEKAQEELIRLIYEMVNEETNWFIEDDEVYPDKDKTYYHNILTKANEIYMNNNTYKECSKCEKSTNTLYDGKCEKCYDEEYSGCYGGGCIGGEK